MSLPALGPFHGGARLVQRQLTILALLAILAALIVWYLSQHPG